MDWWDFLRWANVILAAGVVTALTAESHAYWHRLTLREKRSRPWIICVFACIAYGSGEAATQEVPPGVRVVWMVLALSGLVIALTHRIDDERR